MNIIMNSVDVWRENLSSQTLPNNETSKKRNEAPKHHV